MTGDNEEPERIETSRHDPLLRLDQFIHRQDQMIGGLKSLIKLGRILSFQVALLTLLNVVLLVWLIWK
jgi:hypothetical protein